MTIIKGTDTKEVRKGEILGVFPKGRVVEDGRLYAQDIIVVATSWWEMIQ